MRAEVTADYRKGLLTDLAKADVSANEHGQSSRSQLEKAVLKHGLRTLRAPVDGTVQHSPSTRLAGW